MSSVEQSLNSEKDLEQIYMQYQTNMENKMKNKKKQNLKNQNYTPSSSIDTTNFQGQKVLLYENYKNSSIKKSFIESAKDNNNLFRKSSSNDLYNSKNLKDSKTIKSVDNTFESTKHSNNIIKKLPKNNSMKMLNTDLYNKFRTSNSNINNIHKNKNNSKNKHIKILHSSKWKYRPLSSRIYKFNNASFSSKNIFQNDKNSDLNDKNSEIKNLTKSSSSINISKSGLSLPNEKYYSKNSENEIKKIYSVRYYILNNLHIINQLNENKEKEKNENDKFRKFYDDNIKFINDKNKKNEFLYQQKLINELKECSFHPKLTKSTLKIINNSNNYEKSINNDDFYKKSIQWKKNHDNKLQNERTKKEKKDFEECYFHPITNPKQHEEVLENLKDKKEDYIYQKNINWLKQKELNKKEEEMENEEKREIEIAKFKNENKFLVDLGNEINKLNPVENLEFNLSKPKFINTKFEQIKRNSDIRNKNLDERCKWLINKIDPDENFVSYDSFYNKNYFTNTNYYLNNKNIYEKRINLNNTNSNIEEVNYDFQKDINDIKNLISTLKNIISENKAIIKGNS